MDDDLFDDEDLDSCQIYDFVKDAEKREREDEERKLEEERRRRIDDDEDYEVRTFGNTDIQTSEYHFLFPGRVDNYCQRYGR